MFYIVIAPDGAVIGLMTSPVDARALQKPIAGARVFTCQPNSTNATEVHEPLAKSVAAKKQ